jgi:hypothetical protein
LSLPVFASLQDTQPFRRIYSGTLFWVLGGPVCRDGYPHWLIEYYGYVGWIPVSGDRSLPDGGIWVVPVAAVG